MKEIIKNYLQIINEDIDISSKYINKTFFETINHNDVFISPSFFNAFPKDFTEINLFVNKFIEMVKVNDLNNDKEYLVYIPDKKLAVIVSVYVKGSFRHDVILLSSFNALNYPSIQKSGQVRIVF